MNLKKFYIGKTIGFVIVLILMFAWFLIFKK